MAPILLSSIMAPSFTTRTMASIRRKRRRRKEYINVLRAILDALDSQNSSSSTLRKLHLSNPLANSKQHCLSDPVSTTYFRLSTSSIPQSLSPDSAAGQPVQEYDAARIALAKLLQNPIDWQPASKMTFESERRLRPRPIKGGSPLQVQRQRITSRIEKTWPARCARVKAPKGIFNPRNYCYRRSVMQSLLHLPQFMRWIDTHGQGENTCSTPGGASRCLACAMRAFIPAYWNPGNASSSVPRTAVTAFDNAFRLSPVVRDSDLTSHKQEDADQFLTVLLDACRAATSATSWTDTFSALFRLSTTMTDTCSGCGHTSHPPPGAETTLRLAVSGNTDSLSLAVARAFRPHKLSKRCEACSTPSPSSTQKPADRVHVRTQTVDAAPDMLVVQLVIYDVYGRKTRTRVGFSEALDLSRFQTDTSGTSLKYKLASVVSHDGASADSGHYIAHVSGPQRTHIISDEDVRKTGAGALTAAVQRSPRGWGMFDPYLLFFTRVG